MYVSLDHFNRDKNLPDWYTEMVHRAFTGTYLRDGKLQAVKYICEYSKQFEEPGSQRKWGLKWGKDTVEELILLIKNEETEKTFYDSEIREATHDPVLVNNVVTKVLDHDNIIEQSQYLTHLIKYIHPHILEEFLKAM